MAGIVKIVGVATSQHNRKPKRSWKRSSNQAFVLVFVIGLIVLWIVVSILLVVEIQ